MYYIYIYINIIYIYIYIYSLEYNPASPVDKRLTYMCLSSSE